MTATRTPIALFVIALLSVCGALGPFLGYMNTLFHGMDFSRLVRPQPFAIPGFVAALIA